MRAPCSPQTGRKETMRVDVIVVGQLDVNCYIVTDTTDQESLIIDPGDEYERIQDTIQSRGTVPKYIVFTHAHYDHVCAVGDLKGAYNTSLVMHEDEGRTYRATTERCVSWGLDKEDFPLADRLVRDGDSLRLRGTTFHIMHTPGHSPGSICLYGDGTLFTGDTLFAGSVGRTDLPGGNSGHLRESLRKILALPDETVIRSGHGPETTLKREKETNPFLSDLKHES